MAFDNTVVISGNLTADPELRFTQGGMAVANVGIAYNHRVKEGSEERTSFFNLVIFRKMGENVVESLSKGDRVTVTGQLQQRTWEDKEGNNRSTVEILVDDIAPSLRWATATPTRNPKGEGNGASADELAEAHGVPEPEPAEAY